MRTHSQIATDKENCIKEIHKRLKKVKKPRPLSAVRKADVSEEEYEEFKEEIAKEREEYLAERSMIVTCMSSLYGFKEENIRRVLSFSENINGN
jgi:hypothetical protein